MYKERDSIPGGSQLISGLPIHCGQARKISKLSKTFLPLMAKRKIIEVKQWMQYSTSFTVAGKLIIVEIPISPENVRGPMIVMSRKYLLQHNSRSSEDSYKLRAGHQ